VFCGHEAFLNKLRRSRRGVCIDIDAGKQVGISPVMNTDCSATEFYPHATSYQIRNQFLKRVPRCYIPFSVVGRIMRCHVARVGVEDWYNLGFGIPVCDVLSDELEVEEGRREIPLRTIVKRC
jgi:hypothetical protein